MTKFDADIPKLKSDLGLREWQRIALLEWTKSYRGIVSVVTGGGKTFFACLCIVEFLKKRLDGYVVVVVPTLTLLDQWVVVLTEDLQIDSQAIGCFSSAEKSKTLKRFNVMVVNSARKRIKSDIERGNCFLIVDECHRMGSPINGKALLGEYAATLGLSATPQRNYDHGFERYIKRTLGEIIYSYGYLEALKDGVISPFNLVNVQIGFLPHEQKLYNDLSKKIGVLYKRNPNIRSDDERLQRLLIRRSQVSSAAMMRVPTAAKIVEREKHKMLIIFHETIAGANAINTILVQKKFSSTLYHTGIGPSIRRDNLRLFRKGVFQILVTCKALDEGMNAPETSVAVIASSTASPRQRIQRLGRVLRPAKGKEEARIYTVYITDLEKKRLIEESKQLGGLIETTWMIGESTKLHL